MGLCQGADRKGKPGKSNPLKDELLSSINQLREQHQVDDLRESPELTTIAQTFSEQLAKTGTLEYSDNTYNEEDLGEILFMCTGECTCEMIIDKWNEDAKSFKYRAKNPEASSFAQLVWKSSKLIGIGIAQDGKDGTYVVANFYPAGNVQGQFADNVLPVSKKGKKNIKNSSSGKNSININYSKEGFSDFCIDALEAHNRYRKKHHADPLILNKELCKIAQNYAQKLLKSKSLNHSGNKYKKQELGENLFMCGGQAATGEMATTEWYNEIKQYNFRKDYQPGTGHFTQVVWKGTKEVGFGMANDGNEYYVVGNYFPAGNFTGQFHDNVIKA